jgi:hypothetical protein
MKQKKRKSTDLETLIARAKDEHDCKPGASATAIAAAERRLGFGLPADVKRVLQASNGIHFWANADYPCRLLPTTELKPARTLLHADEGSPSIIALFEVESDYVGIDLDPKSASHSRIIYCSHETFPFELSGMCDSFTDALELVIESKEQEWVWPAVLAYDVDFAE